MKMEISSIQWFPGHMTKTKRQIEKQLKLVDIAVEIIDARVPLSSRNQMLDKLIQGKPKLLLLNKADMADPTKTAQWVQFYKKKRFPVLVVDCKSGKGLQNFTSTIRSILSDQIKKWSEKGMIGRIIRVMIFGIPNSGKSSLINRLSKEKRAFVEDRPGVTRSNQWFRIAKDLEILDTPGVLWPKFNDPLVGERLAFTGAILDAVLDTEYLAARFLETVISSYELCIQKRYKLENFSLNELPGYEILELIGKKRGMLLPDLVVDTERASVSVLDDFRGAKLGKITLEQVSDL